MGHEIKLNTQGTQCIGAWLCEPAGTAKGGVVVVQEIFGVNAHIRDVTQRFADAGYTAIAPAFFDHLESGVELDYDARGIARGRELAGELDMGQSVADVGSAAQSIASAGRIAVVGYCWGGTVAFVSGLRLQMPAISFYGSRNVQYMDEPATAAQQFHFGERDGSIPPEAIERHRQTYPDAEIYTYDAGHGFNCDLRKDFDAESSKLAWQRVLDFLSRHV